jgi:hypothetical protein
MSQRRLRTKNKRDVEQFIEDPSICLSVMTIAQLKHFLSILPDVSRKKLGRRKAVLRTQAQNCLV